MKNKGYKLANDETIESWTKALCSSLKKTAPDGIKYTFEKPYWGAIILASRGTYSATIKPKVPSNNYYGDVNGLLVRSNGSYGNINHLGRSFKVKPDGTINLQGIHACIKDHFDAMENLDKEQESERETHDNAIDSALAFLADVGIKAKEEHGHIRIDYHPKGANLSATISSNIVYGDALTVKLGTERIPLDRIHAFLEAYKTMLATLKSS